MTGGTWEAGTLSVGLATRILGTTCGSTYTMHVRLVPPFLGGVRIVHFENGAIWPTDLCTCNMLHAVVYKYQERVWEWDYMHMCISGKESWSGMTCNVCIHAICVCMSTFRFLGRVRD